MIFIFKIIFYFSAIIFIVDKCGASNDKTTFSNSWNKMKIGPITTLVPRDVGYSTLTNPQYWDIYNHWWRAAHQGDRNHYNQVPIHQNHLDPSRIQITVDFNKKDDDYLETKNTIPKFSEGENEDGSHNVSSRFGEVEARTAEIVHSNSVLDPQWAQCSPEQTTVQIDHSEDPYIFYFPSYTRLGRCGGCCNDPRYSCQVLKEEYIKLKVLRLQLYLEKNFLKLAGDDVVENVNHLQCECRCKVRQEDCVPGQLYKEHLCACIDN